MLSVQEAQEALLSGLRPLTSIRLKLLEAIGYSLAEDVYADIDNPPFDNSAVDGFAVRSEDMAGASPENPVTLVLVDEVSAGVVSTKTVPRGGCIRIMTGAPIPSGADAIVMVEDTQTTAGRIEVTHPARSGDHVRNAGRDVRRGQLVVRAGSRIQGPEVGMLAAMGRAEVMVTRRPRVAVISTGDEVVEIATRPGPGQIRNSNGYALAALVAEAGGDLHSMTHIPDDERETEEALRAASGIDGGEGADVIVTSGGVSVGEKDFVKPALEQLGTLDFWRVNMKPGKPIAVGRIAESLFFGLPGNPVSTMVTFELFVRPALRKLFGQNDVFRPCVQVTLTEGFNRSPGREEYVRAKVLASDYGLSAKPTGAQGSGVLSSMLGANALLVLPPDAETLAAGDRVTALLFDLPESAGTEKAS